MRSSPFGASLPPVVPNFTGRQSECEEIIGHVSSESIRLLSIWGTPGFGKTSVAIKVGHALQSQGMPVYWVSLRGVRSKADLASKFLSLLRQLTTIKQPSGQCLSVDEEVWQLFSSVSNPSAFILDNFDDWLESGLLNAKEEVMQLLEEILRQNQMVTFVVTTRESLKFMDLHFQGHKGLRIRPLDKASANTLVSELLPKASTADCTQIAQICGQVPLAMKLMCSLISEDSAQPRQIIDDLMMSSTENRIIEMLNNPDYPNRHRIQFLFDSSFKKLTMQEKDALISLSILPESFSTEVAAAVLSDTGSVEARKILGSLRRKSLIDSSSKPGSFTMHRLLQSFAREKGKKDMPETFRNAKSRLNAFYVSLLEKLNEQFLTGNSMAAYIEFYENKKNIIESVESYLDSERADSVYDVLVKGEIFLAALFCNTSEAKAFFHIYDTAIKAASLQKKGKYYRQLLSSRAFGEVTRRRKGKARHLLSKVNELQAAASIVPNLEKAKYLSYKGIYLFVTEETNNGVQFLKEALLSLENCNGAEKRILEMVNFQILAVYFQSLNDLSSATTFYDKAIHQCSAMRDWQLLIIPSMKEESKESINEVKLQQNSDILLSQPLKCEIIFLLSKATKTFANTNTKQCLSNSLLQIVETVEREVQITVGLLTFHNAVTHLSWVLSGVNPQKLYAARIKYYQVALKESSPKIENFKNDVHLKNRALASGLLDLSGVFIQRKRFSHALQANQKALEISQTIFGEEHESTADSYRKLGVTQAYMHDYPSAHQSFRRTLAIRNKLFGEEHESTADSYRDLGVTQHKMNDYKAALQSKQCALTIRIKLLGEEHESTADSYRELGVTQAIMHDYASALQSQQRSLAIRMKLFGEEHESTADSYRTLGVTQANMHDYTSSLQSFQRALAIRSKLFGEEHESTADSYGELGVTQAIMHDYASALQSQKHSLAIRMKLFGEEHESTADSYRDIAATQHEMKDYKAALQSKKRALAICIKLFGDEHERTAYSYRDLGVTQHEMKDYKAALQSKKRALAIRIKLFGEEHESTADSYKTLGVTEAIMHDYTSALQSQQRTLAIRIKLFGEEHENTADSYRDLGVTQHEMKDYKAALQSKQRALTIRIKVFGEDHESTADSYRELGVTQAIIHDYASALQSQQRSLAIRMKLFGEEHESTADSYMTLGVTQAIVHDYASALQFQQRSLATRIKLFGEEHESTADSYRELGVTQAIMHDYASALQSQQRSLAIRMKLFGEEHESTADSYRALGVTEAIMHDYASALQSQQRSLAIRIKLFGEEHESTADSYRDIGVTQHEMKDYNAALQSKQRALAIRIKLFGDEHERTADSYTDLGVTQHEMRDYKEALQSKQCALEIHIKLFGEEHESTADSYRTLGVTEAIMHDYASALQS